MKLPSLFRTPKPRRFNLPTRYYDPVKEDIEQREKLIRSELEGKGRINFRDGAFRAYHDREKRAKKADSLQLIFVFILTFIIFGYIYFGNLAFYLLIIVIPFYIWIRMRKSQ